jgi:hypothetical protein
MLPKTHDKTDTKLVIFSCRSIVFLCLFVREHYGEAFETVSNSLFRFIYILSYNYPFKFQ